MSTAEKFVTALKKSGGTGETSTAQYWRAYLEHWTDDLKKLRLAIQRWLDPVVDSALAHVVVEDFSTTEPDLGTYMAPGLKIELLRDPPITVLIRPRGGRVVGTIEASDHRVVGACGRVDLECGPARAILLRFLDGPEQSPRWLSFADGNERELDEAVFFELLARCAGVQWDA